MRAQEEERRRLARDLHDEVNQALTAILLRLEALAQETPPERAPEVAELKRLVNQAMDELLNLARQLRPSALDDHGLVPGRRDPAQALLGAHRHRGAPRHRAASPTRCPRSCRPRSTASPRRRSRTSTRHAGATVVELDLEERRRRRRAARARRRRRLRPERAHELGGPGGGLGLVGMAERARLVGGELDVRSAPGGGTTITLRVPA